VAVVNPSALLNAKKRVSEGTSLGSIRLWVALRRRDGLTDGLGKLSSSSALLAFGDVVSTDLVQVCHQILVAL